MCHVDYKGRRSLYWVTEFGRLKSARPLSTLAAAEKVKVHEAVGLGESSLFLSEIFVLVMLSSQGQMKCIAFLWT